MDNRKVILLVGAALVAVLAAFFAHSLRAGAGAPAASAQVGVMAPAPVDGPQVLVATRPLPVGTILDPTALKFLPWPQEQVDGAYYLKDKTDLKALAGTVVRYAITAGQPITQGALVKPGDRGFLAAALGPGMRAVTFPVSAQSAVAGFVFPGDRIDLVLTQTVQGGGAGQPLKVSETIMRNVRVLATDQRTDNSTDESGKSVVKTFGNVTVEATPKIAEQLAVAQQLGTLSISLRSLADNPAELAEALASGQAKGPSHGNMHAVPTMVLPVASGPQTGDNTFATGADVSRFARRSVPGKGGSDGGLATTTTPPPVPGQPGLTVPTVPTGPVVRVARGNAVTIVPVGGK